MVKRKNIRKASNYLVVNVKREVKGEKNFFNHEHI